MIAAAKGSSIIFPYPQIALIPENQGFLDVIIPYIYIVIAPNLALLAATTIPPGNAQFGIAFAVFFVCDLQVIQVDCACVAGPPDVKLVDRVVYALAGEGVAGFVFLHAVDIEPVRRAVEGDHDMVPGIQRHRVRGGAFNPLSFVAKAKTQVPAFDGHAGVSQCSLEVGPPDTPPLAAILGVNPNGESKALVAQIGHAGGEGDIVITTEHLRAAADPACLAGATAAGAGSVLVHAGGKELAAGLVQAHLEHGDAGQTGNFVRREHPLVDAHVIHIAAEGVPPRGLADIQVAGSLITKRGVMPIAAHFQSVAVDGSRTSGGIVGAGPVVPILVRVGRVCVQVVGVKATGEFVVGQETDLQGVVGAAAPLADDEHVPATDYIPFGPVGHGEGLAGQIDAVAGVQEIIAAVELDGVADHALLPGLGATAAGAKTVAGRHIAGKIAEGRDAAPFVEGEPELGVVRLFAAVHHDAAGHLVQDGLAGRGTGLDRDVARQGLRLGRLQNEGSGRHIVLHRAGEVGAQQAVDVAIEQFVLDRTLIGDGLARLDDAVVVIVAGVHGLLDVVLRKRFGKDGQFVQAPAESIAPRGLADEHVTGTLVIGRGGVLAHLRPVAVDRASAGGSVVGAGPVVPILVRIGCRGVQIVAVESAGESVVGSESDLQGLIGAAAALAKDEHVMATGGVPFGPEGHGEGLVGQSDAAAGVQIITAAVEYCGVAIATQVAGGRTVAALAGAVVGVAGNVAKGGGAVGLLEAQEHDRGVRLDHFR